MYKLIELFRLERLDGGKRVEAPRRGVGAELIFSYTEWKHAIVRCNKYSNGNSSWK